MYIYYGFFPYIGGKKIPLHYYTLLYPQLESIWRELVEYIRNMGIEYSVDKHNIEIRVDEKYANDILTRLHASYMLVEGVYEGEPIEHSDYLRFLWKNYSVEYSKLLLKLAEFIENDEYDGAYVVALEALRKVAETENIYAKTKRRINHMLFEMLNGGIPQTFINTYQLAVRKAAFIENIAKPIYASVADMARRVGLMLRKNVELMDKVERTSRTS